MSRPVISICLVSFLSNNPLLLNSIIRQVELRRKKKKNERRLVSSNSFRQMVRLNSNFKTIKWYLF